VKPLVQLIKSAAHRLGLDVVRANNSPMLTYLSLRDRDFPVIFDVGSNTGTYAANLCRMFPKAQVFCFEPVPSTFSKLEAWASGTAQVTAVNLALGNHSGELDMHLHDDHTPSSSLLPSTTNNTRLFPITARQSSVRIKAERLDVFVKDKALNLGSGALMKIDVQGYELAVLEGARDTLKLTHAVIVEVILDDLYENQSRFEDVFAFMIAAGFRYAGNLDQHYADDGHVMWIDAVFVHNNSPASEPGR
jgi:FkbM family methyltransferase